MWAWMKVRLWVAAMTLQSLGGSAQALEAKLFDNWDSLLQKVVDPRDGRVDYIKLLENQVQMQEFIGLYRALNVVSLSDNEKKSIYINLYNAFMMQNILRYAEEAKIAVKLPAFTEIAINKISVSGGNIWNGDFKTIVGGKQVNLDNIEHDLIRNQNKSKWGKMPVEKLDPRIHAAVNCAALSCPRVREKAYRPETVDQMLEENIKEYVSSAVQFKKLSDTKLRASSIVFWYYSDFDTSAKKMGLKGAGDYLAKLVDDKRPDAAWMKKHLQANFNDRSSLALRLSSAFSFEYQWKINDQRNSIQP